MGVLSSIIGGIFGLGEAGINANSQAQTNAANYKIAQMNNDYNYKMFQEQQDYNLMMLNKEQAYNTEMWNKTNEYNSAENQVKRLQAAGLNPYMMMSGGNAGTAQGVTSPSAQGVNPPTAQQVNLQPVQYDLSTAAGFLTQAIELNSVQAQRDADAKLKEQQAAQVGIENKYKAAQLIAEINEKWENAKNTRARTTFQDLLTQLQRDTFSSDVLIKQRTAANIEAQTQLQRANKALVEVNTEIAKGNLRWLNQEKAAQLAYVLAQTYKTKEEAKLAIQNTLKSAAETAGIKINNDILERSADSLVDKAYYEGMPNSDQRVTEQVRRGNKGAWFVQGVGDVISNVLGLGNIFK